MSFALLDLLRNNRGQWLSLEALRVALDLHPRDIHQRIEQLQIIGYAVEWNPAYGVRLVGQVQRLSTELLANNLKTKVVGRRLLVYDVTDSTNDVAWHHVSSAGYDGLVVFAESQRKGRGRLGRIWHAGHGKSILCSVLLQKDWGIPQQSLTLLAGLATALSLESYSARYCRIKWPNDVIMESRKIAGILVESRRLNSHNSYVIGIGINCLQDTDDFESEIRDSAISLQQILTEPVDRVYLAQLLLEHLDQWLIWMQQDKGHLLHEEWVNRCDDIGRGITLQRNGQQFTGRVIDVTPEQGLLLQLDTGGIQMFDGAVTTVLR
jgi:BirA family biotin operon repressor/biotin-[acetyl-CoA-carboxylase] ligase